MTFHRTREFASAPIGQVTAEIASPLASKFHDHGFQHATHVTDFLCWKALSDYRAMGASGRKASRKLNDDEFDDNMFSRENGDGEIY